MERNDFNQAMDLYGLYLKLIVEQNEQISGTQFRAIVTKITVRNIARLFGPMMQFFLRIKHAKWKWLLKTVFNGFYSVHIHTSVTRVQAQVWSHTIWNHLGWQRTEICEAGKWTLHQHRRHKDVTRANFEKIIPCISIQWKKKLLRSVKCAMQNDELDACKKDIDDQIRDEKSFEYCFCFLSLL